MGWLGDDILEVTPCFLISEKLKQAIEKSELKGYKFQNIEISLSEEYEEMYPDREKPCFYRLLPQGTISVQDEMYSNWDNMDFCVTEKSYLRMDANKKKCWHPSFCIIWSFISVHRN